MWIFTIIYTKLEIRKQNCFDVVAGGTMERIPRSETRYERNLTASARYGEKVFSCITKNISKSGIYLEAIGFELDFDRNITISVVGDDTLFELKGDIIWNKTISSEQGLSTIVGLGIKLTEAPSEYLNYIDYLKYE